jgi:hypothetical protein
MNSDKGIPSITKQQTGQSRKKPTTKSPNDIPESLNNPKEKKVSRELYLKEKSSARGFAGTANNSTS